MKQYVSRRRRSWTPLTQMDPVIHLSERHRSDMLLDLNGLTRKRRVEEQASINNESDFTKSQMPSSFNNHLFIFGKVGTARKKKAKILLGFGKKINTLAIENLV